MSIFDYGGQEYFTYELLTLSGGVYKHSQWISNYIENASIDIDFDRSIISGAKFKIKDLGNVSGVTDINYLSDLIKPWYNFVIDGTTYTIPLGHYMLLSPQKQNDGNVISRNIDGYDLLKALDQDKTIVSKTFSSGTNVVTAIEGLLDDVGTWVNYQIEPSSETLSEDVSYELGKSILFIINSLLNMINYYQIGRAHV